MVLKLTVFLSALVIGAVGAAPITAWAQPASAAAAKPLTVTQPLGPELWRGARIGMTPGDVAALFPKATASAGETLPDGSRSALMLAVDPGDALGSAQFYFGPNGLDSIIVNRPDVVAHDTNGNLAKAHRIQDQLTTEHGQPSACTEQRRIAALTCVWILGDAKAILSYRDIGGAAPALNVSFRRLNDAKPWTPGPVKRLKRR